MYFVMYIKSEVKNVNVIYNLTPQMVDDLPDSPKSDIDSTIFYFIKM